MPDRIRWPYDGQLTLDRIFVTAGLPASPLGSSQGVQARRRRTPAVSSLLRQLLLAGVAVGCCLPAAGYAFVGCSAAELPEKLVVERQGNHASHIGKGP